MCLNPVQQTIARLAMCLQEWHPKLFKLTAPPSTFISQGDCVVEDKGGKDEGMGIATLEGAVPPLYIILLPF